MPVIDIQQPSARAHDQTDREIVSRAFRSLWMLKRHRADFAKVTAERIRMIERFISNPQSNSSMTMRIIDKPLAGL